MKKQAILRLTNSIMIGASICLIAGASKAEPAILNNSSELLPEQQRQLLGAALSFEQSVEKVRRTIEKQLGDNLIQQCENEYQSILNKEKPIQIHIAFGYQNGELSMTEDITARKALRDALLADCQDDEFQICGFSRVADKDFEFEKQILLPNEREQKVIVSLTSSSYTAYDFDNQNLFLNEQNQKSLDAQEQYVSALKQKDVVFYVGHSRDGGGPDFFPPKLLPEFQNQTMVIGDKVDYGFYKENPDGIRQIVQAIQGQEQSASIMGLFSCDSAGHFLDQIEGVISTSKTLMMTIKVTDKTFESMLMGLNATLSFQCRSQLNKMFKTFDGTIKQANPTTIKAEVVEQLRMPNSVDVTCEDVPQIKQLSGEIVAQTTSNSTTQNKSTKADFILVSKTTRKVYLLNGDVLLREYPTTFGYRPKGHKERRGDGKTPEGLYYILAKNPHSKFHKALKISYPNSEDVRIAKEKRLDPGGQIMLHGLPVGKKQIEAAKIGHPDFNWTSGCVAVNNQEIDEIYRMVDVGTPIRICP